MAKILVTGYGGFLGAEVTRQLLASGFQVRGIARGSYPQLVAEGVETLQGDISDEATVQRATQDCDAIVHTAAKAGVWGSWNDYYSINTQATLHLLKSASQNRVRAFVHSSSPSVTFDGRDQINIDEQAPYPNRWLCYYPQTKALAEQAVLAASASGSGLTCALRPHLIWGQNDPHLFPRLIQRARQGRLRRVGTGENLIDTVHVSNAAKAHVEAVKRLLDCDQQLNGQALFLTDGSPIGCWQWISQILQTAEVAIPTQEISFHRAYRVGAMLEFLYWTFRISREPPMTRFVAAQLALHHYFSIDRARSILGYEPEMDREEKLKACGPWLRSIANGHAK